MAEINSSEEPKKGYPLFEGGSDRKLEDSPVDSTTETTPDNAQTGQLPDYGEEIHELPVGKATHSTEHKQGILEKVVDTLTGEDHTEK